MNEARDARIAPGPAPGDEASPIPGFPGYFITRAREVWSCVPMGRPRSVWPATGPEPWRRLAVSSHLRRRPHVFVNRDGRKCFVAVEDLYEAAFPSPDPSQSPAPPPSEPAAEVPDTPTPPTAYRPVPGFPGYCLTPDRAVWSSRQPGGDPGKPASWRPLAPQHRQGGPPFVLLYRDGRRLERSIDSLYRATYSVVDLMGLGPESRGSGHHSARLDEAKVLEARRLKAAGWSYPALVKRFGVGRVTLWNAITGRTWSHVPMPTSAEAPAP